MSARPVNPMEALGARVFAAYAINSGNLPGDHYDRNAGEQWMAQALAECGVADLIAAAQLVEMHIAAIGYPADEDGAYDKDGEWTFAEAVPQEVNAREVSAAFRAIQHALARIQPETPGHLTTRDRAHD